MLVSRYLYIYIYISMYFDIYIYTRIYHIYIYIHIHNIYIYTYETYIHICSSKTVILARPAMVALRNILGIFAEGELRSRKPRGTAASTGDLTKGISFVRGQTLQPTSVPATWNEEIEGLGYGEWWVAGGWWELVRWYTFWWKWRWRFSGMLICPNNSKLGDWRKDACENRAVSRSGQNGVVVRPVPSYQDPTWMM